MRTSGGSVGPRVVSLLFLTAVAGIILAVHGWSGRQSGPVAGAFGGPSPSAPAGSHASRGSTSPPGPRGSPAPSPTGGGPARGNAATRGPLLRAQSYAPYAYLVWPGTPSAAAKTAETGLSISVRRTGSGISVRAGVIGQPNVPSRTYQAGARVYVVEVSLGDEAGSSDYNLGDDGLVVTNAHGRILQ